MTILKLNISNENHKNLKKIYSNKIDFKNKRIIKYYKLDTKKPEICPFCKENYKHIHIHGCYSKCLKNLKPNLKLDLQNFFVKKFYQKTFTFRQIVETNNI